MQKSLNFKLITCLSWLAFMGGSIFLEEVLVVRWLARLLPKK
jgi:hypothetical protein